MFNFYLHYYAISNSSSPINRNRKKNKLNNLTFNVGSLNQNEPVNLRVEGGVQGDSFKLNGLSGHNGQAIKNTYVTLNGGGGNDAFYVARTYQGSLNVDGGQGNNDKLYLPYGSKAQKAQKGQAGSYRLPSGGDVAVYGVEEIYIGGIRVKPQGK
ncbi:MAG: hypothetical protein VKK59_07270 [Vampirovibrionales bacterium]|nr:hypothetical protein [Vampirovibrionales bacterium]